MSLLKAGCDVECISSLTNLTPLMTAVRNKNIKMTRILVNYCDVNYKYRNRTVFDFIEEFNCDEKDVFLQILRNDS